MIKYFSLLIFVIGLSIGTWIVQSQSTVQPVEFVQLQPYKTLNPGDDVYIKVGTIGTNELAPCLASTRVWNTDLRQQVELESYCRIQSDGYAAVSFKNEGTSPIGIYDKVRVIVFK